MTRTPPTISRNQLKTPDDPRDESGVWPAIVNVYRDQGFDAGYARGINEVLAQFLEATEDFVDQRPESAAETRRLLHSFSEYLHHYVRRNRADHSFIDGLGI
jgi:hypothetical protein